MLSEPHSARDTALLGVLYKAMRVVDARHWPLGVIEAHIKEVKRKASSKIDEPELEDEEDEAIGQNEIAVASFLNVFGVDEIRDADEGET